MLYKSIPFCCWVSGQLNRPLAQPRWPYRGRGYKSPFASQGATHPPSVTGQLSGGKRASQNTAGTGARLSFQLCRPSLCTQYPDKRQAPLLACTAALARGPFTWAAAGPGAPQRQAGPSEASAPAQRRLTSWLPPLAGLEAQPAPAATGAVGSRFPHRSLRWGAW